MGDETAEQVRGRRQSVSLSRLYLDPNNFRFVDHPEYRPVTPERVYDADVQRRTTGFVLGRHQENVRDLIASIKENGWLDIDPILARKDGVRFLVVEGNRRVATLKYLQRRHEEDAIDLGKLDSAWFSRVPVLQYEDADERYRESDYGDQFQSDQYNLFREVLKSEAARNWLGWNHATCTASNGSNLERLFSWMSREAEPEEGEDEGHDTDVRTTAEPVITTGGHIRELARIIQDPKAVRRLDETRSLQEATLSSDLLVKSEVAGAFEFCDKGIQRLNSRTGDLTPADLDRVEQLIGNLQGIALARKRQPPGAGRRLPWQPFNEITQSQFSSIRVESYRGIDGLVLDSPGRVNLIVGVNNAGKTSLLEAIYLLAHQNDERALLDAIRWRGRVEGDPDPLWLVEQLPRAARLSGRFDQVPGNTTSVEFEISTEPEPDVEDQTSFLSKLRVEASYGGQAQHTDVVFFEDRPRRTSFQGQHWLCRAAFTSPFSANRPETLARCNKESLEAGTKQQIIDFIRERVDPGLRNIELADRFNRFLVSHDDFDKAPDLAAFGEGVRRVFEIGLLFAGVRGGVLLVDEFENPIHTELLVEFTRLVQDLAVELDVQVFLSTHSKEAIDAFVLNGHRTEDVVGYAINRTDSNVKARRYDGRRLHRLHDAVDFDLRGVR